MKTLLLTCTAAIALVAFSACEEGDREHHHHHDHDRGQTTSTTMTEQTTVGAPVGVTESRTVRTY